MVISNGQEVLITTSTARRSANCLRTHVKYVRAAQRMVGGLPHNKKNEWNKWKNHFYEMKGDVGINVTS